MQEGLPPCFLRESQAIGSPGLDVTVHPTWVETKRKLLISHNKRPWIRVFPGLPSSMLQRIHSGLFAFWPQYGCCSSRHHTHIQRQKQRNISTWVSFLKQRKIIPKYSGRLALTFYSPDLFSTLMPMTVMETGHETTLFGKVYSDPTLGFSPTSPGC